MICLQARRSASNADAGRHVERPARASFPAAPARGPPAAHRPIARRGSAFSAVEAHAAGPRSWTCRGTSLITFEAGIGPARMDVVAVIRRIFGCRAGRTCRIPWISEKSQDGVERACAAHGSYWRGIWIFAWLASPPRGSSPRSISRRARRAGAPCDSSTCCEGAQNRRRSPSGGRSLWISFSLVQA